MPAVNEQYMPNQFGFNFGSVGGSDYYVTNIRIAKDIPATKPAKPVDNNVVENNRVQNSQVNKRACNRKTSKQNFKYQSSLCTDYENR